MSEYEKLHARIAQLVERNNQLGAALDCAYGDLAQAKQIIDRNQKDADRYRWLRQYEFDIGSFHSAHEHNHQAWFESIDDSQIDACIQEENDQEQRS